jgi:uncharacterized protein YdeI (YjbR/CyaY-like superfamily)
MATEMPTLEVQNRQQWRRWLEKHHASSAGVWLVFHKGQTRIERIDYEDSVREALCFGWIDSLIKRVDDDRYSRKFTPRKPTSRWSDSNRKRWAELKASGLLASAGLLASPTGNVYPSPPAIPVLPDYIAKAFKEHAQAWHFFQELAPAERRNFVVWIHSAKRLETRERRIRESAGLLAAGRKLGLK